MPEATPKPAAVQAPTPWTFKDEGSRTAMVEHLKAFKPEGNPDTAQLAAAREFAIAEINAISSEFNGVSVQIDANAHAGARQLMILVLPKTFRV